MTFVSKTNCSTFIFKLREEVTNDEETAVLLNEAGKVTKVYNKKLRNKCQFPIVAENGGREL